MTSADLLVSAPALMVALVCRYGGWRLGQRLGARHAVAWFGTVAGFTAAITLMSAIAHPWRYVKGDAGWGLVNGMFVATIIEVAAVVASFVVALRGRVAKPNNALRPPRFSVRGFLTVLVLLSILLYTYQVIIVSEERFCQTRRRVHDSLWSLHDRCPKEVTPAKWEEIVRQTREPVIGCLFWSAEIRDMPRYYRFVDELDERLEGEVDMGTIDWIWDEFVEISMHGQRSDLERPTDP